MKVEGAFFFGYMLELSRKNRILKIGNLLEEEFL